MSKSIDLTPYQIQRPEKLNWRFPSGGDIFDHIKSKSLRRFLKRSDELLAQGHITWERKLLTQKEYENWLPYYYTKMEENNYDILAKPEWFQEKKQEGKSVEAFFFFQNKNLIGSVIFVKFEKQKASICYKASDRLDLFPGGRSSLGAVIDYFFIKSMSEEKMEIISAGSTRNAFGVIGRLGNLDYKLRFGYEPLPSENTLLLMSVPINEQGTVVFFGMKDNQLALYTLKPKGSVVNIEAPLYLPSSIPSIEIEY